MKKIILTSVFISAFIFVQVHAQIPGNLQPSAKKFFAHAGSEKVIGISNLTYYPGTAISKIIHEISILWMSGNRFSKSNIISGITQLQNEGRLSKNNSHIFSVKNDYLVFVFWNQNNWNYTVLKHGELNSDDVVASTTQLWYYK